MAPPVLTVKELEALLASEFPQAFNHDSGLSIRDIWHGGCRMRQDFRPDSLRPGGSVSGATMMMLSDIAMYVAVLASIGWVPLAVTTNLNINFLRKPGARALEAECRLIKLGRRLAVGEVLIRAAGDEDLIAHATSTYSIPPGSATSSPVT